MTNVQRFGEMLRDARRKADKTLGQVSRGIGVSIVYLSDVERGNRSPLTEDRIIRAANFLDIADPSELLRAAIRERGVVQYDLKQAGPLEAHVVGELVTGLARGGISEETLLQIQSILEGKNGNE
jgi:transcriptional regulator with XRE-family HTH domain